MSPLPPRSSLGTKPETQAYFQALLSGDTSSLIADPPQLIHVSPFGYLYTHEFAAMYAPWNSLQQFQKKLAGTVLTTSLDRLFGPQWLQSKISTIALVILNEDIQAVGELLTTRQQREIQTKNAETSRASSSLPYALEQVWSGNETKPDPAFTDRLAELTLYCCQHTKDCNDRYAEILHQLLLPTTPTWGWNTTRLHTHPKIAIAYPALKEALLPKIEVGWVEWAGFNTNRKQDVATVQQAALSWLQNLAKSYIAQGLKQTPIR